MLHAREIFMTLNFELMHQTCCRELRTASPVSEDLALELRLGAARIFLPGLELSCYNELKVDKCHCRYLKRK